MRDRTPPNPSSRSEAVTAGPPRSVQFTTIALSSSEMTSFTVPVAEERAPYLVALEANSCSSSARLLTAAADTSKSIPESMMRGFFNSSNGATIVRTSDWSVVGCGWAPSTS